MKKNNNAFKVLLSVLMVVLLLMQNVPLRLGAEGDSEIETQEVTEEENVLESQDYLTDDNDQDEISDENEDMNQEEVTGGGNFLESDLEIDESVEEETKEEIIESPTEENINNKVLLSNNVLRANNNSPTFSLTWLVDDDTITKIDDDGIENGIIKKVTTTPKSDTGGANAPYLKAELTFSIGTGGANNIPAGGIKMVLPRYIFTEWDWDNDGTKEKVKLDPMMPTDVSLQPKKSGKDFWYYFANKDGDTYTKDTNGEYLVIENYERYATSSPKEFKCELLYPYIPSRVDDTVEVNIKADFIVPGESEKIVNNDTLTASVDTMVELSTVVKTASTDSNGRINYRKDWYISWGNFSDTGLEGESTDYYYVPYIIEANVTGKNDSDHAITQPYKLEVTEETVGAIIDDKNGNNKGTIVATNGWSASTKTLNWFKENTTLPSYDGGGQNYNINEQTGIPIMTVTGQGYTLAKDLTNEKQQTGPSSSLMNGKDTRKCEVIVAYPKEYVEAIMSEETQNPYGNDAYLTNKAKVKLTSFDNKTSEIDSSIAHRIVKVKFNYKDIFGMTKYNTTADSKVMSWNKSELFKGTDEGDSITKSTINGGKYLLSNNQSAYLVNYVLTSGPAENSQPGYAGGVIAYGLTRDEPEYNPDITTEKDLTLDDYGKHPYKLQIVDDMLFLNDTLLGPGDYEIYRTWYEVNYYKIQKDEESTEYGFPTWFYHNSPEMTDEEKAKYQATVFYRTDHNENWKSLGKQDGTYFSTKNIIDLPKNAIEIKYEFDVDTFSIEPWIFMQVKLHPTERVKNIIQEDPDDAIVTNIASFSLKDYKGKQWNLWPENSMSGFYDFTQTVKERDHSSEYNITDPDKYLSHERTYQYLSGINSTTTFKKTQVSSADDYENGYASRTYKLESSHKLEFVTEEPDKIMEMLDNTGFKYGQPEVIFYDLLPEAALVGEVTGKHGTTVYGFGNIVDSDIEVSNPKLIRDPDTNKLINRRFMTIKAKLPEDISVKEWAYDYDEKTHKLSLSSNVQVTVPLTFMYSDLQLYSGGNSILNVSNDAAAYIPGTDDGHPDDASVPDASGAYATLTDTAKKVFKNLHTETGSTENDTYYSKVDSSFRIVTASLTGFNKEVRADSEPTFRINSAVNPGENYTYRLRYSLASGSQSKDIIIYDVLETAYVDEEYLALNNNRARYTEAGNRYWLGTFESIDVSELELLGVAPVVYYSTYDGTTMTDREAMQEGLDELLDNTSDNDYSDLTNTSIWTTVMPEDKKTIRAIAIDCRKDNDGNDFILNKDGSAQTLTVYIRMKSPGLDEVMTGWDKKGDYIDPRVYAFNNSFLHAASKTQTGQWSNAATRLSDGTTVRTKGPKPPIFKMVEDLNEKAGGTCVDDMTDNDGVVLDSKDEEFKYTITSQIPYLGTDTSGNDEKKTYTLYDTLVRELEVVDRSKTKITIGSQDDDFYFVFDPEGDFDGHKGYLKARIGQKSENPIYEEKYFDSWNEMPDGLKLGYDENNYSTSPERQYKTPTIENKIAPNTVWFELSYETDDGGVVYDGYDRVRDFAGRTITMEFVCRVRDGATVDHYADGKVPNNGKYIVPNTFEDTSNTVYVEVPPVEPEEPDKKVSLVDDEGNTNVPSDHQDMDSREQRVKYVISGVLPENSKSFVINDEVEDVLEIDTNSIRVRLYGSSMANDCIEENVSYDEYGRKNAEYYPIYDDNGNFVKVPVEFDSTFTLDEIILFERWERGSIRLNATEQSIGVNIGYNGLNRTLDALVNSEFVYTTYTNPQTGEEITYATDINQGKYGATTENSVRDFPMAGANIEITFECTIKKDADLEPYRSDDGNIIIPNKITYQFGDNPERESEPVTITPPDVTKDVNGVDHVNLADLSEIFTYTIQTNIPVANEDEIITEVLFTDTLENVLEFVNDDETTFTIAGYDMDTSKIKKEGQLLSVDLTDYVEEYVGEPVVVSFKARIKDGLTIDDLKDYIADDQLSPKIPNEAIVNIKIDNGSTRQLKSKPVTVTPPVVDKKVNGKYRDNLTNLSSKFVYSIRSIIPKSDSKGEVIESFEIMDTLENVLEFTGDDVIVRIDGKEIAASISKEGKKLVVSLDKDDIANNPDKVVEVIFMARIVDGADLSKYKQGNIIEIPNTASYIINNNPDSKQLSNTVYVVPPRESNPPKRYTIPKTGVE